MPGCFISLDGVDGSGKSSQAGELVRRLTDAGFEVVATREPGGTPLAETLRGVLLTGAGDKMDAMSELLLFTAARHDHIERVIKPALNAGKVVISDRFVAATMAYQGVALGLGVELVDELHQLCNGGLQPDIQVMIDIEVETALARSKSRLSAEASDETRFENRETAFHRRLAAGFEEVARRSGDRLVRVDGERDFATIAEEIFTRVRSRLATSVSTTRKG